MRSPASVRPLPLTSVGAEAVLVSARLSTCEVGVVVDEALEVTVAPAGLRPVTVAVLLTAPPFTSVCVITYGAVVVQVVLAPGASVVTGQVVAPALASTTASELTVCAPVLVTAKAYAMRSPASTRPLVFVSVGVPAVLVRVSVDVVEVGVAVEAAFEVTVAPAGFRPAAVAVLLTAPASTSAWVITYGAVVEQVVLAPGASVPATQVVAPTFASAMATPVTVTAPVLVTPNEKVSVSPASTRPLVLASTGVPAVLVRARVATVEVGVVVLEAFEVTVAPPGFRAAAVAVLFTAPAFTSAWVITYGAVVVQLVLAPGASVVAGHVVTPTLASVMASPVRVTAPVLVTRNV
ncbi:hypothetical protein GCM10009593_29360 [Microlunatus antarcticus]